MSSGTLIDPCGLICCFLIYVVTAITVIIVNHFVLLPRADTIISWSHMVCYNCTVAVMLVSHVRCMVTNPGRVSEYLDKEVNLLMHREFLHLQGIAVADAVASVEARVFATPQQRNRAFAKAQDTSLFRHGQRKWWCKKCNTFKPRHAHHCSNCRACVLELDHHCPWVNNCVGWRNHKYFLLFVGYAWLGCLWSTILIIYAFVSRPTHGFVRRMVAPGTQDKTLTFLGRLFRGYLPTSSAVHTNTWVQVVCGLDCIVVFLLVIFTCAMGFGQWDYMSEGYGIIDKKQFYAERASAAALPVGAPVAAAAAPGASRREGEVGEKHAQKCLSEGEDNSADDGRGRRRCRSFCRLLCRVFCCDADGADECCFVDFCDTCCSCSEGLGCKKLPEVMGEPVSCRWLLPLAPRGKDKGVVPDDVLVAAARWRAVEEKGERGAVDEMKAGERRPLASDGGLRRRRRVDDGGLDGGLPHDYDDSGSSGPEDGWC